MSSTCLLSVKNFSHRISLIREVRNAETKENSQRGLNNNNILPNIVNPENSLEGLMLKLKFQYSGPPDAMSQLIGKDPDVGED